MIQCFPVTIGLRGEITIGGITVLPSSYVAADTMTVFDSSAIFGIVNTPVRGVEMGYTGSQFIEDEMSFKVSRRVNLVVPTNNAKAVQHVPSIATAITNLTTI